MKKIISLGLVCLILLFGSLSTFGQDTTKDLRLMQDAYQNLEQFSTDVLIEVFTNATSKQAEVVRHASIQKRQSEYKIKQDNHTMLYNAKCMVLVDEKNQNLHYTIREPEDAFAPEESMIPNLDSILNGCDSIRYRGIKQGLKQYTFYRASAPIKETQLFIDPHSNLIQKLEYRYNAELFPSAGLVRISYQNLNTNPRFQASFFSETQYVTHSKKGMEPSPAYSLYTLTTHEPE